MRYVVKVRIVGFQSHEDTTITFRDGVNALTGPSDNGKSAVLRAIKWALWNQAPDNFVRNGCTLTQAEVTFSDGTVILRERAQKRNKYVVTEPGKEPLTLVDFGTKVPAEVINAHGMRPVQFKAKKASLLNFGGQLEAPFFLDDSPLERADILGRLAGVQVIDRAMDAADREKRSLAAEIKTLEEQANRVDGELAAYADLDNQERRVAQAEELLREVQPLTATVDRLRTLQERWTDNLMAQDETAWTIERLQGIESAALPLMQAENAHLRVQPLTAAGRRWRQVQADLLATEITLERLAHTEEAARQIAEAETANQALRPMARALAQWRQVTAGITEADRALTRLAHTSEAAQAVKAADEAESTRQKLARLKATRDDVRKLWNPTKLALKRTTYVHAAHEQVAQAQEQQARLEKLNALRSTWTKATADQTATARSLESAAAKLRAGSTLEAVATAQEHLHLLQGLRTRHQRLQTATTEEVAHMTDVDAQIQIAAQEYGRALRETRICPTCLQVIHPETAAQIAASLITEEAHSHVS